MSKVSKKSSSGCRLSLAGVLSRLLSALSPFAWNTGCHGFMFFTIASTACPAATLVSHVLLVRKVHTCMYVMKVHITLKMLR